MADLRCPNCGKENPDFLDLCQFCQAPLRAESQFHIGEEPTKKNTGELEEILPDWLKDARQKGKDEQAPDEAFRSTTRSRVPDEPPDLLAGLMSQSESEDEAIPDWLAGISPVEDKTPASAKEEPSDFFAQFKETEPPPAAPPKNEPPQAEQPALQQDDLTDWLPQETPKPTEAFAFDASSDDDSWLRNLGSSDAPQAETPAAKEPEDLGWLRDLEASAKGPGESSAGLDFAPAPSSEEDLSWLNALGGTPAPAQPASAQEDLGWLNDLGGMPAPAFEEPAPAKPASSDDDLGWLKEFGDVSTSSSEKPTVPPPASSEDLDWLKTLGGTPAPAFEEPAASLSTASQEDLDWLKSLGGTPAPAFEEPAASLPTASQEDLDWLKSLGGTPAPAFEEPAVSEQPPAQDDLAWLSDLGGTSEAAQPAARAFADTGELNSGQGAPDTSKPFQTAPLKEFLEDGAVQDTTPDWLKSALEEPSMPAPGALSMDWFNDQDKARGQGVRTPAEPAFDLPAGGSSSAQDIDSLFMEMPDWMSSEAESAAPSQPEPASSQPAFEGDSLAPVELPSWVQAMRPVDSAIGGTPATTDMVTEREGPLAGFRGVIPMAQIGSSLRPKAFSLKLQVTEEQEAAASLLEKIIATEGIGESHKPAAKVSSQRLLRWALSGLFLLVLGTVLALGLQGMPILAPASANELSALVAGIPENAPVLVVIDYEPSFAGELEASAGPLLDQLALARRSTFTFVAMSPNGAALVDRLMFNTNLSKPAPLGLDYKSGAQYVNAGFLPGGSSGVLGFIESPQVDFAGYQAVLLLTDNAESGRVWVEQLEAVGARRPEVASKPLLLVSSAQAGPMLRPYVDSGQADILVNGLYDAAKYELVNVSRPGLARSYWDAFGYGLMLAVAAIVLGGLWSIFMRLRERRATAEQE